MRIYQVTIVLRSDISEEVRDQILGRVMGWLPKVDGDDVPETKVNHWGRRQLAYPINKLNEGYYVLIETPLDAPGISEFERNLTYVDEILRHLVVLKEG